MCRSSVFKRFWGVSAVALLAVGLGAGLAPAALADSMADPQMVPLPIEALAQYESLTGVNISPDGHHIVGLVAVKGQKWPVISIWDADDLAKTAVWIPSATNRIVAVDFFSNDKIYFLTEQEIVQRDGKPGLTRKIYMSDLLGKTIEEPFRLTGTRNKSTREELERGNSAGIFNDNLYDQNLVLLSRLDPDTLSTEIVEYNKTTGATRLVAKDSERFSFASEGVDLATGEPLIKQAVKTKGADGKYYLITEVKDRQTGQWVDHPLLGYRLEERVDMQVLGFDEDPGKLLVRTNRGRNFSAIYSYDLASKSFASEPLFANDSYNISNIRLMHNYTAKKVEGVFSITIGGPAPVQVMLDPKWEGAQASIKAAFPGKSVFLNINRARERALVAVESPDSPSQFYLFSQGKLQRLGGERPWIDSKTLGRSEWISFKARDGLDIPAIITYPPGWTPAKGPVSAIVMPHGGPWQRDYYGWDISGWPQFLATRNIAVIQPQYRGTDGLGDKLWKAGDGQWGLKMSDDNDDAAAYLVAKGIADPKRLAIFGYSYGGYAAIAATVRPGGPYKCAISGAGVASLERVGNLWGGTLVQQEVQGRTVAGLDPMKHINDAHVPIMLYHGDHDRQADTDHSRMFYKAMKAAGKDIEYTEIKGMWHQLPWRPAWHTQSLTLIEAYLKSPKCGLM